MAKSFQFSSEIRSFYEQYDESSRLASNVFQLEYARTQEILLRYLPRPPAVILDVGGGPGVYACWLAQRGYEVHLVDPVPLHLEQARQRSAQQPAGPIAGFTLGDARQLDFAEGSAHAILLLGPLYHLIERSDRILALREALRVLHPGGVLCAAIISRFASALSGLFQGLLHDPTFAAIIRNDLRDGQHRNPTGNVMYFTEAYFHRPEELAEEIAQAGLQHEHTVAIEGVGWLLQNFEDWWSDEKCRTHLLEIIRHLESDSSLLGASAHLIGIARKKS
ncbi:MAG: class I SAM-dependent methyltransferase [bacterium]